MEALNTWEWDQARQLVRDGTPRQICLAAPRDHFLAGSTALHIAAWKNPARGMAPPWQFDFYMQLCNKGRDVLDYRNGRGLVPLHQAASVGNDRMFEALLSAGACAGIRRQSP